MSQGERKCCPRCGETFRCMRHADRRCDCRDLVLPAALTARLAQDYPDCLCITCLRELARQPPDP